MPTGTSNSPLTVISSMATRHVLTQLADMYESEYGRHVSVVSVGGVEAARRIREGEQYDVAVLAADALERLGQAGHVAIASRVDLARSRIAVAVKQGDLHCDISSEASVRAAVLRARTIGYSTGPSGTHIVDLLRRWGIADIVAPRIVEAPIGVPVGRLVAEGKVELGFQQLSELVHETGIDVIGMLPPSIQSVTVFSAGICTNSSQQDAARSFLKHLTSREGDPAKTGNGMEPI